MTEGAPAGRRLLQSVLALHLLGWAATFFLSGRYTVPAAWLFQVPLWVAVPVWLKRQAERGSTPARWLFALLLAFLAVGNVAGAAAWLQVPEQEGRDEVQLAVSAVLAAGYAVGAAVVGFSPAVGRVVAAGRAAKVLSGGRAEAEPV